MKKLIFILTLIISAPFIIQANENSIKNAGFVPSNIWYSKASFFANENIRIYTIIFNGSQYDLEGTVEFFDEVDGLSKSIGKTDFSISGGGRVRDIWIDWRATEGKHFITAQIIKSSISLADGTKKIAEIENAKTGKSEILIDLDTDGDKIGNKDDIDDDNDGIPDNDELKNKTNPLKSDSNGNGVSDKKEAEDLARKIADNKKNNFEKVENVFKVADDLVPKSIKNMTIETAKAVESFRSSYGEKLRVAKENKLREIKNLKKEQIDSNILNRKEQKNISKKPNEAVGVAVSAVPKKPFAYAEMASLAILQYFFDWKFVFYGVDFYVLYRLMSIITRRFFRKKQL